MKDNYTLKGLRLALVKHLRTKGITDERILNAFLEIPRHFFLDPGFAEWAYKDVPFKIGADQTISQPFTVAFMTQLLEVEASDTILEVGTGSGYQACVLSFLGAKVYSIERQELLYKNALEFLPKIGFGQIRLLFGDGYEGAPRFAPFDKIIVTAGAKELPTKLIDQLKVGGCLVVPLGGEDNQEMIKITKTGDKELFQENFGTFKFVPFLPGVS